MRVARLPLFAHPYNKQDKQTFSKEDVKNTRFSFVVSKKAAKKAVTRNKIRRIGYNVIQKNIPYIKGGFLAAIFIKKSATELSKKELGEEILSLLQKADLLKTKQINVQENNN